MNKQKGSVLTVTVLCSAILSLFAAGLFALTLQDARTVGRLRNSVEAFFLAESGISETIDLLMKDFTNKDKPGVYPSGSFGHGSYSVTITQPSGRVLIHSTGTAKSVNRDIFVEVKWDGGDAFDFGVTSNGKLTIEGNSTVTADTHSNNNISVKGNGTLAGNGEASGTVSVSGNGSITGTQTNSASTVSFPTFDFNYYYNLAQSGGLVYTGNQTFSGSTLAPGNGVVYVNGNVTISSTSHLTGVLVSTGKIQISGTFTQTQVGNYPALMSRDSDIKIGGTSTLNGLVYTSTGDVDVTGGGTLSGQIISKGKTTFAGGSSMTMTDVTQTPPGLSASNNPIKKLSYHE